MASHLRRLPSDHDPSLTTTSSTSSSSSSSSSSETYGSVCCYNSLKLSPPYDSAMPLTVLVLLIAFFFMGFFSIYIRRFADESSVDPRRRRRRGVGSTTARSNNNNSSKGVDPKIVESFPVHAYEAGGGKQQMECSICLADFEDKEAVKEIPYCSHAFHVQCIDTWLSTHNTCPLCRTAKLLEDEEEEGSGVAQVHGTHAVDEVRIVVHDETDTWNENTQGAQVGSIGARRSTTTCSSFGDRHRLYRSLSF